MLGVGVAVLGGLIFELGFLIFPFGILISLRSKKGGSKWGLAGLVLNGIGAVIIYGGILMAFMLPIIIGSSGG